jgi:hypothetical protein
MGVCAARGVHGGGAAEAAASKDGGTGVNHKHEAAAEGEAELYSQCRAELYSQCRANYLLPQARKTRL